MHYLQFADLTPVQRQVVEAAERATCASHTAYNPYYLNFVGAALVTTMSELLPVAFGPKERNVDVARYGAPTPPA